MAAAAAGRDDANGDGRPAVCTEEQKKPSSPLSSPIPSPLAARAREKGGFTDAGGKGRGLGKGGRQRRWVPKAPSLQSDSSQSKGPGEGKPPGQRVTLGVCCMASKATSKPMEAILRRLFMCGDFDIVVFPEPTILNLPPAEWPIVECLIAFSSSGFPLSKCIEYVRLRNPRCINNVEAQEVLISRVSVYRNLQEWCIPCPDHVVVDHLALASQPDCGDLVENENFIIYKGKKISKPFVEKPENGDRHDIWIYYPRSIGGGAKKLFRKVKDQASEFDPAQNTIRRDGVYLYEPFLPTQGTDIKVYTVGAGYVHAEARKAPTVDGKVNRSKDGKEVRYPVVLTQAEKAIAAFIVKAFRQNICGFDILRTDGGSIVCDVNGWSFVKGNQKYYNDCATLIRKHLLEECGVSGVDTSTMMILGPGDESITHMGDDLSNLDYSIRESLVSCSKERLRSVIVIMRHGDRRPKEKLKFKTKLAPILTYFDEVPAGTAEVKLKQPEELTLLKTRLEACAEDLQKQLKKIADAQQSQSEDEDGKKVEEKRQAINEELTNIELLIPVLEMQDRFVGLERKVQLKAIKWKQQKDEESARKAAHVQVVAKWGGELTKNGLMQAQDLGYRLRHDLYPHDPTGLLRLHSSFRHDFKIYSSQEGRCQITAAAFTKGFLDLDGDIVPILVSLVTRESYAQGLLDEPIPKKERDAVKQKIESLLLSYESLADNSLASPTDHGGLREAARRIGSPMKLMHSIRRLMAQYIESLTAAKERTTEEMRAHEPGAGAEGGDEDAHDDAVRLGHQLPLGPGPPIPEDLKDTCKRKWLHLRRKEHRWAKLFNGFVKLKDAQKGVHDDDNVLYDTSKIPDVWDNLYYDLMTHRQYLGKEACQVAESLVELVHPLNEWVCLSEYGISESEKVRIGVDVTWRLIGKMLNDLEFMIEDDSGTIDEAGRHTGDRDEDSVLPRSVSGSVPISIVRALPSGALAAPTVSGPSAPSLSSIGLQDIASPESNASNDRTGAKTLSRAPSGSSLMRDGTSTASGGVLPREWKEMGATGSPDAVPGSMHSPLLGTSGGLRRTLTPGSTDLDRERRSECSEPMFMPDGDDKSSAPDRQQKKRQTSVTKLTPEVRSELKQALRDASDWHPRLNDQVAELTDIKNTRIVRSRIYVTSASTMHSLCNILRHGQCATDGMSIVSDLGHIQDLNYLTHLVFRCYERDEANSDDPPATSAASSTNDLMLASMSLAEQRKEKEKTRYRVEISISPGVQVFEDGWRVMWPQGHEMDEPRSSVAPLEIIGDDIDLAQLEKFLAGVVKEYGPRHEDDSSEDDANSGD